MYPLIPALIGSLLNSPQPAPQPVPPAGIYLRSIPATAARGKMQPPGQGRASIGGKDLPLAPGVQIRDQNNRIILSDTIRQPLLVKYLTDASGEIIRVWVLTPAEAGRP